MSVNPWVAASPIPRRPPGVNDKRPTRDLIMAVDGPNCAYCGILCRVVVYVDRPYSRGRVPNVDPMLEAQVDHVLPRSRGGADKMWNAVLACKRCNSSKGRRRVHEWRGYQAMVPRRRPSNWTGKGRWAPTSPAATGGRLPTDEWTPTSAWIPTSAFVGDVVTGM